ncbi:MAG: hypothetical protein ACRC8R_00730 [Aeromonas hydrophila]|uniref:hypothetical protein n=1 Tax=Aeromonas hydrophila TaxID=644 RepID=UPI002B462624|nr:hypothetical protein [Aeromonas hydrophila]
MLKSIISAINNNKYIIASIICTLVVSGSYYLHFKHQLNYDISDDTAVWGQLGDYIGGILNPILSFISIVLLIKSLKLQGDANNNLQDEMIDNKKSEILRSFETHFFNMINSQKVAYDKLKIEFPDQIINHGIEAVLKIEDHIESIRDSCPNNDQEVIEFLELIDEKEQIYSATRIFYIMVKLIEDKLNEQNGFTLHERKSYMLTLINFTDFSLLRLILISMQFFDYPSVRYLKNSAEFNDALKDVNLNYDLY